MPKNILVVGGAGYIGSHVNQLLHHKGYRTIVFDNLSRGSKKAVVSGEFIKGDLASQKDLSKIFKIVHFDAVMHFAALTDVAESQLDPMAYYRNNVTNSLNLFQAMLEHDVKSLVFSSSAAIFGMPQTAVIAENHPCEPINVYGRTKLVVETVLKDLDRAYGLKSSCLRYFNAAGWDPSGEIPYIPRMEKNLIPKVFASLAQKDPVVTIYGVDYPTPDGTCLRDYVHVCDLAEAHILALEQLWQGQKSTVYNLGNVCGYSVHEVVKAIEIISGRKIKILEGQRRQGDPFQLIADSHKAIQELGWKTHYPDLKDILKHTWAAMSPHIT